MTPAGRHSRVGLPGAQRSRAIWGCTMSKRIGMVAGEPSGDLLASRIIAGLQAGDASVRCEGIGGPQMQARDFNAWHPMHALTVFGYVDALAPAQPAVHLSRRQAALAGRAAGRVRWHRRA